MKLKGSDPTTNSGKQKLKKLREHHRPCLAFTQQIAEHQNRSGDDFLLELPLRAQPRHEQPVVQLENDEGTYTAMSYSCCLGLRTPKGVERKEPIWWLTSAPEIAYELNHACCCHEVDSPDGEAQRVILKGLRNTLARKNRRG